MKTQLYLTFLLLMVLAVAGCGESPEQVAKRLGLPPEPAVQQNATLLGVDSNHNNIRDDLERMIGFALPAKEDAQARKLFKREAELIVSEIQNADNPFELHAIFREKAKILEIKYRKLVKVPEELQSLDFAVIGNNVERMQKLSEARKNRGAVYFNEFSDKDLTEYLRYL